VSVNFPLAETMSSYLTVTRSTWSLANRFAKVRASVHTPDTYTPLCGYLDFPFRKMGDVVGYLKDRNVHINPKLEQHLLNIGPGEQVGFPISDTVGHWLSGELIELQ
jgi:hypothetical protein